MAAGSEAFDKRLRDVAAAVGRVDRVAGDAQREATQLTLLATELDRLTASFRYRDDRTAAT